MKSFCRNHGQTLVEMIVALGILVLVVLALVRVTITATHNAQFARSQAQATKYAQEGIEEMRAYRNQNSWQDFVDKCGLILEDPPDPLFSLTTVCDCPTFNGRDTCSVTVTVSWTDSRGTHQSELTTRFTNWRE